MPCSENKRRVFFSDIASENSTEWGEEIFLVAGKNVVCLPYSALDVQKFNVLFDCLH